MLRILVLSILLVCSACTDRGTTEQQSRPAEQPAVESAGEAPAATGPPNQQMVECLNRFREKKYEEALTTCRRALSNNPGDPQILKAIELSEQALKEGGA